jgi:hypothetical protein
MTSRTGEALGKEPNQMSNKKRESVERSYRMIAKADGTYTVEVYDGTGVITKKTGFSNRASASAWIDQQKRAAKPPA